MTSETAKESTGRATFTIKETAVILRIGKNSAYQAARRGELPVVKIGGRLLVPRAALERLLLGEPIK